MRVRITALAAVALFVVWSPTAQISKDVKIRMAPLEIASAHAAEKMVPTNLLRNAYFGELHLHTSYSLDAFMGGNRLDPFVAYRFARGEEVKLSDGSPQRLRHPLDFAAVTDHSEMLGEEIVCTTPGMTGYDSDDCNRIRTPNSVRIGANTIVDTFNLANRHRVVNICGGDGQRCVDAGKGQWKKIQQAAAQYYEPGVFTTLVAYEFSPIDWKPTMNKVHRNVIYRTADVPDSVFSAYDGTAEDLHLWLETNCLKPCQALTIPHNPNMSSGRFFWGKNSDGTPWTKDGLARRYRVEPLVEIVQIKGASECQTGVGLADEECGFELLRPICRPGVVMDCVDENSFVRNGIVKGLAVEEEWGVNPFKYGFIGSTDGHTSLPGDTEETHFGNRGMGPGATAQTRFAALVQQAKDAAEKGEVNYGNSSGGLAGVWAEKNTREAIWDALARRETFGTSGTRMRVRFFGGFDFGKDISKSSDLVKVGYQKGVPMGGDLIAAPSGKSPTFVVMANRDPDSAPLQKIQIIKGWVDGTKSEVKVYDVVCSDGIKPDPKTNLCADNNASVDLSTCKYTESKGAAQLAATWTDPQFDPNKRALYYVRVLENPTCRWSTYDAIRVGAQVPKGAPVTIKERAWSSPIWYTPAPRERSASSGALQLANQGTKEQSDD